MSDVQTSGKCVNDFENWTPHTFPCLPLSPKKCGSSLQREFRARIERKVAEGYMDDSEREDNTLPLLDYGLEDSDEDATGPLQFSMHHEDDYEEEEEEEDGHRKTPTAEGDDDFDDEEDRHRHPKSLTSSSQRSAPVSHSGKGSDDNV